MSLFAAQTIYLTAYLSPNEDSDAAAHSVVIDSKAEPSKAQTVTPPSAYTRFSSSSSQFTGDVPQIRTVEPLPINLVTVGAPKVGLALVAVTFGMLLTFFWLRICRLSASLRRRDQHIRSLLAIDPLTSLSNRESLYQAGETLLTARPQTDIALLSINLDRFRTINEGFGYQLGDELLRQVAHRIKSCITPNDTLARMGNDEFSLLLMPQPQGQCSTRHYAQRIAEQILHVVHQPFCIQSNSAGKPHTICVKASLGIAIAPATSSRQSSNQKLSNQNPPKNPPSTRNFSQLLSQANAAMTQVKQAKSRQRKVSQSYLLFQPEMDVQRVAKARFRQDIQRALHQTELRVRYQPIVDLTTAQPVGFEALVRWQHPTLGLLSPSYFLPIAEDMGLIADIDRWVMQVACQQLMDWQAQQLDATISVNVSGSHLGRLDLVGTVKSLLSRYPIDPAKLNLEVTEGVMIADPDRAITTLRQLREIGLNVSLDDFGTGYCSFSYLQQFPVNILKIDKSFVSGLLPATQAPNQDNIIVESLLTLSERLGIRVVAEGIERTDQYQQLQQMRCAYGQGNLFAKPMTGKLASKLLKKGQRTSNITDKATDNTVAKATEIETTVAANP